MKKIFSAILIASCCAFIALPAQAQVKWGIKGGLNMTKIDWDKLEKNKDNMAGFFIGPMAEFTLPVVGLGIDAAVLFSQKGIKAENDGAKQLGLDIPVNLKYNIGLGSMLGIFIAAGPDFYFDFKGDENSIEKKKASICNLAWVTLSHWAINLSIRMQQPLSSRVKTKLGKYLLLTCSKQCADNKYKEGTPKGLPLFGSE